MLIPLPGRLIERALALPLSAQDKQLLLLRSLSLKILHLSRVANKSDVLDTIRKEDAEGGARMQ
jgi:hypothetical protein